jgi:hypothetical protein
MRFEEKKGMMEDNLLILSLITEIRGRFFVNNGHEYFYFVVI